MKHPVRLTDNLISFTEEEQLKQLRTIIQELGWRMYYSIAADNFFIDTSVVGYEKYIDDIIEFIIEYGYQFDDFENERVAWFNITPQVESR